MLLPLLFLFIAVPIAELFVIIQVGEAIGALPTIALLIVDSVVGSMLMRSQGRAVWKRFNLALAEGRTPGREVLDGVLVIFGGAFLLTPGFLTDVIGGALLLPPSRAVIRRGLVRRLAARVVPGPIAFGMRRARRHGGGTARADGDVDGTAVEVDETTRQLP